MTTPVSSSTQTNTNQSQAAPTANANGDIGNKQVFLQLLVSQIKNQDPLNPMDSTNFVTQLAQFSQLEATLGIRSDLQTILQTGALPDTTTGS